MANNIPNRIHARPVPKPSPYWAGIIVALLAIFRHMTLLLMRILLGQLCGNICLMNIFLRV